MGVAETGLHVRLPGGCDLNGGGSSTVVVVLLVGDNGFNWMEIEPLSCFGYGRDVGLAGSIAVHGDSNALAMGRIEAILWLGSSGVWR